MITGRRPKPTQLKILNGAHHSRLNPNEPKPGTATFLLPPACLSKTARHVWREQAPRLAGLGLLTVIDIPTFTIFCTVAGKILDGATSCELLREFRMYSDMFGMNPCARSRLSVTPPDLVDDVSTARRVVKVA